jgi:hypothetical protein
MVKTTNQLLLGLPHGCSTSQDFCFWPWDSFSEGWPNHQPPTFPTHAPTAPLFKASELADGPLFSARRLVDKSYHGHYIVERQRFQDSDLEEWASGLGS